MTGRQVSHGRGGAGNIGQSTGRTTTPDDLKTPTIKQNFYTTGRGGTGNMMQNDRERPELARGSQDVEAPPQRSEEQVHFTGRGGVANAFIPAAEEEKKNQHQMTGAGRATSKERPKDVLERTPKAFSSTGGSNHVVD